LEESGTDPVDHQALLTFEFNPVVNVEAGVAWELLDGDDNIYSAVWPVASDIDPIGLPGAYEVYDCQYNDVTDIWYSVLFTLADEVEPDEEKPEKEVSEDGLPGFEVILFIFSLIVVVLMLIRRK
jgi:hypothetical protein